MTDPIIIGLNCAHDASACVLINGKLVAAVCEERLTRLKHQDGFPRLALLDCLDRAGLDTSARPSCVVINQCPPADHERKVLELLPKTDEKCIKINPSHHLLHACYAWSAAGFDEAAILIVDGSGYSFAEHSRAGSPLLDPPPSDPEACEALTMLHCSRTGDMRVLHRQWGMWKENSDKRYRFPSIGHMYSLAAQQIFGSWTYAGKVMGLAPYGDPNALDIKIIRFEKGQLIVDTEWIEQVPPIQNIESPENDPVARNLAARVQYELERAMLHQVEDLWHRTHLDFLCLSGGVALNSVCNGRILRDGPFSRVFITPAAQDAGTAIGAAVYGHHLVTGSYPTLEDCREFFGRSYSSERMEHAIHSTLGIRAERIAKGHFDVVAREISEGYIIAWFEGKSEFGPRALGHRSILADARRADIKDVLNHRVKFRESFRPYAAAVLEEECSAWFEINSTSPYMLLVGSVRPDRRSEIPGVVHVDGTCRIQTVDLNYSGGLRQILEAFYKLTGVPLLINTSLNLQAEPICEMPEDAIRCLSKSGLDALYFGNQRIAKWPQLKLGQNIQALEVVPVVYKGVKLITIQQTTEGSWIHVKYSAVLEDNRIVPLSPTQANILQLVDGQSTVVVMAKQAAGTISLIDMVSTLELLRNRGILIMKEPKEE